MLFIRHLNECNECVDYNSQWLMLLFVNIDNKISVSLSRLTLIQRSRNNTPPMYLRSAFLDGHGPPQAVSHSTKIVTVTSDACVGVITNDDSKCPKPVFANKIRQKYKGS